MNVKMILAAGLIAVSTAACAQNQYGTKQTVGALGGAALGGLAGAQFGSGTGQLAATAAGVVLEDTLVQGTAGVRWRLEGRSTP